MQNPVAFADVFNVFLYNGQQVIKPEELIPMDTTEIALPHAQDKPSVPMQKVRDVLKKWVFMTDGQAAYCLLGIENQDKVHYAMPVRNLVYDAMRLARQVQDIAKKHRQDGTQGTSAEYLGGFWKGDTLLPVITLVIYWGADEWDGALQLSELYGTTNPALLRYALDYRVNLISPKSLTSEKLQEFHSSLRQVLTFIKYSQDKDRLREITQADSSFADMDRQDVELINAVIGNRLAIPKGKERVNVCKAIDDMIAEGQDQVREKSASNTLRRYYKRKLAITNEVLADIAEDNEISIDRVRHLAAENGISLA